ncbi:MAG: SigE family RNA polymerase sigma factor [Actinobacteria bacterium]|nr:SigE family RNA polymerase sigma factor [Actinomycetota bacterium]MCA1722102.1 SigE family RNA polymerase sigma factor [Actinomycetota bacterium]
MTADFESYVRARHGDLRRLAYLLCGDWPTADDLVQTALIRCERRWPLIRGDAHGYVRQAVVNAANSWRVRHRFAWPLAHLEAQPSSADPADVRLTVTAALARLPIGQRQVLVLRYWEGMPEAEIAELLGISAGTVKSRAARALAVLRGSDLRELVGQEGTG